MSESMFNVSSVKITRTAARKMEAIAKQHGAWFIECTLPGSGYRRWFAAPNMGDPFNRDRAKRVRNAMIAEHIIDNDGNMLAPYRLELPCKRRAS